MRTGLAFLVSALLPLAGGQESKAELITRIETIFVPVTGNAAPTTVSGQFWTPVAGVNQASVAAPPAETPSAPNTPSSPAESAAPPPATATTAQATQSASTAGNTPGNTPTSNPAIIPLPVPIPGGSSAASSSPASPAPSVNGTGETQNGTQNGTQGGTGGTQGGAGNGTANNGSTTQPEPDGPNLNFGPVSFAGYNNYIYRTDEVAAQVVISQPSDNNNKTTRFITAFPNGNTGALVYLLPYNGNGSTESTVTAQLVEGSLAADNGSDSQTGIKGVMTVSADAEFGVTILGGVRTLRDYVESGGKVMNSIFNYTIGNAVPTDVELVRHWINGTTVQYLSFHAMENCQFGYDGPAIRILRNDKNAPATVSFSSRFNYTGTTPETPFVPLEGLGPAQLFLSGSDNGGNIGNNSSMETNSSSTSEATPPASSDGKPLETVLNAIHTSATNITQQMAFLSYKSQFLAGGWRFLTYFGRDTLIALRLLLPVLSPEATEAILAAVIQRTNATSGELCHEETVGDYASFLNMNNGQPEKGNTPLYAYSMVDTDFLLLPVLADYAVASPDRAKQLLARNSSLVPGTFEQLLSANIEHVLALAAPFGAVPNKENLVAIRDANVGNWRDSNLGLGGGKYPFDVNCALVPAALKAIQSLAKAGVVSAEYTNASTSLGEVWSSKACEHFAVPIAADAASTSLNSYISAANLSTSLLYGAGSLNASKGASSGWNEGEQVLGGSNGTMFALSLKGDGSPVPILNSDLAFVLEYADPSASVLRAVVQAMQPYPRGLLTNAGMVVANAAYDGAGNATLAQEFGNTAYHGAVSWSWQTGMMAQGISRQLGRCGLSANTQLGSGETTGNGSGSVENNGTANGTAQNNGTANGNETPNNATASASPIPNANSTSTVPRRRQVESPNNGSTTGSSGSNGTTTPPNSGTPNGTTTPNNGTPNGTTTPPNNGTDSGSQDGSHPAWCEDTELVTALQQAQARLWAAIDGTTAVLYTEVWSPVWTPNADGSGGNFTVGDLGALSPEGTEGDAVQLWSYGFLAAVDPRNGRPVAAGIEAPATPPSNDTAMSSAAVVGIALPQGIVLFLATVLCVLL